MLSLKTKRNKWGGNRDGAGRPGKEPTKTLSYRVPFMLAEKIDKDIRKLIAKAKK